MRGHTLRRVQHPLSNCTHKKRWCQVRESSQNAFELWNLLSFMIWSQTNQSFLKNHRFMEKALATVLDLNVVWRVLAGMCFAYGFDDIPRANRLVKSRGNVIVYSAAIGACEEGRQWQQAGIAMSWMVIEGVGSTCQLNELGVRWHLLCRIINRRIINRDVKRSFPSLYGMPSIYEQEFICNLICPTWGA